MMMQPMNRGCLWKSPVTLGATKQSNAIAFTLFLFFRFYDGLQYLVTNSAIPQLVYQIWGRNACSGGLQASS